MASPLTPLAVEQWLCSQLSLRCGLSPEEIDPSRRFTSYGIDSLGAADLVRELANFVGAPLPETVVWEFPTIEALAAHLAGNADAAAEPMIPLPDDEPIAVVGMACRLPGAPDLDAFWRLLTGGVDAVQEVPPERWDVDARFDPDPQRPGTMNTRRAGLLDRVDQFDPQLFGISRPEAVAIDPQQRLLLELAWEGLEDAGLPAARLRGQRAGVFVGAMWSDYARLFHDLETITRHTATGLDSSILAARLSYWLGLEGPSFTVNTACSSSLVAVHLACESLRRGESTVAFAGGVNLILSPASTVAMTKFGAMAPDGRCKTFDARADGYVRGEGAGLVLLKPLSRAREDGDRIYCVVRGTAINNDGESNGLTAPSRRAQEGVLRDACARARVVPTEVDYVEAHGTGTRLGDPIEVKALASVYARERSVPLLVGSVKTNLGHLEAAAGVTGFIKVALSLCHRTLPPSLHYERPNPAIPFETLNVRVQSSLAPWPETGRPAVAGVSSFGFGGTNSHAILQEYVPAGIDASHETSEERPLHLLTLSARTEPALRELAGRYAEHPLEPLPDACFTANTGRTHLPHRLAVVGESSARVRKVLSAYHAGRDEAALVAGKAEAGRAPRVAFLFTGQGSVYPGMGRELYRTQPTFRAALDRCAETLDRLLDRPLLPLLFDDGAPLEETRCAQPALFALQYALAELWQSWGVEPDAVLGHSVGELAAACRAGGMSLPDALELVAGRARLMQSLPDGGGMTAVFASEERVRRALGGLLDPAIAAVNGPESTVLSGSRAALAEVAARLEREGIASRPLAVSHAFHSPLLDPVLEELEALASRFDYATPRARFVSALEGANGLSAAHWRRHAREPVRFADGMRALREAGCELFIEIGPHPVLVTLGRSCVEGGTWLPSLRRGKGELATLFRSLAETYVAGVKIDWHGLDRAYSRRRISLPTYPFQRERCWPDHDETLSERTTPAREVELPAVAARARSRLPELQNEAGAHRFAGVDAELDRLAAAYAHRALTRLGWDGKSDSLDGVSLDPRHARLARRLLGAALDAGPHPVPEVSSTGGAAVTLVRRCGEALAAVLSGEKDPLEVLFPGGSLEDAAELYRDCGFFHGANRLLGAAVEEIAQRPGRLRVLELGAGTGGTTAAVLPALPADRTDYCFSDVSPLFLARAREALAGYPFVRYELLDLTGPPAELHGPFDLVLASNVVHATPDLHETLRRIQPLLAPGGILALIEVTTPSTWLDLVVGTLDGWWKFADTELRPDHPLLPVETWRSVLSEAGFGPVEVIPDGLKQSLLLARAPRVRAARPSAPTLLRPAPAAHPTPPPAGQSETEEVVRRELAAVLGIDCPGTIDAHAGFFQIGLDSLTAVAFRHRLETTLARPVPAAALFARPNVRELSDWLAGAPVEEAEPAVAARSRHEPIAVVGVGCRLPGGVGSLDELARLLFDGRDAIVEVPGGRWDVEAWYDPDPDRPGKICTRYGGFLDGIDRFDAEFFGISPREAVQMDPQHRLVLEVGWEALEHAGQSPKELRGSRTGVFVGSIGSEYGDRMRAAAGTDPLSLYTLTGQANNTIAGRLSYFLGLQGPSLVVDTACSSSLVALHLACQSILSGECDTALAGGVNVLLAPEGSVVLSRARMLAPDGRCKVFDAAADGYVRGEGCGMVVLRRLSDAAARGDRILAVVRGSAVKHDGHSSGFTVPNGASQEAVIREALAHAGVDPEEVTYVEAHGTGTALGDPIEVHSLAAAYGPGRTEPLALGSVKTNLGHLEAAAGIAGLLKVVAALGHRRIPPHLHLKSLNPHLTPEGLSFTIPVETTPWEPGPHRRLAGVSSFGASGTNVHLIVEEAPPASVSAENDAAAPQLLPLSAANAPALRELIARAARHLEADAAAFSDTCFTAGVGRAHFPHRTAVVARTAAEARRALSQAVPAAVGAAPPRVAFLFTGQGSQYPGMARGLYETEPRFRAALDRCAELAREHLDVPLLPLLFEGAGRLEQTGYTQPALFAVEYALAELWQAWGVRPAAVIGHSVGEFAAACVAGVLSLEDAFSLVAARGRLMQSLPAGGGMATVFGESDQVRSLLGRAGLKVVVAAENAPGHLVLAGEERALAQAAALLREEGIESRPLAVSHAFHSPLMEPILDPLQAAADRIAPHPPRIPVVSNLTAAAQDLFDGAYWRQHARECVRFAEGIRALAGLGIDAFVEIGPQPVLTALGGQCVDGGLWLPSLRRGADDRETLLRSLGTLYELGVEVDWEALHRDRSARRVTFPTYPFQRERFWFDSLAPASAPAPAPAGSKGDDLLTDPGRRSAATGETLFEVSLDARRTVFLQDHRIHDTTYLPATVFLELAWQAAARSTRSGAILAEVDLHEALPLPLDAAREAQLCLAQDGSWQLYARDGEEWRRHATGRMEPGRALGPVPVQLDQARSRCRELVSDLYGALDDRGFHFGPRFRRVVETWRGAGEAVGRIDPGSALGWDGPRGHPILLDCALQVLAALMPDGETWMPARFERCAWHGPVPDGELWSHASVTPAADGVLLGEVRLCAPDGRLVAELCGVTMRRVSREVRRGSTAAPAYEVTWQPHPLEERDAPPLRYAVLPDHSGVGLLLADRLLAGDRGRVAVCPELAALPPDVEAVVDLRALDDEAPETVLARAAALVRELGTRATPPRLWLVSQAGEAFDGAAPSAAQAALRGFARSAALEYPGLRCGCVDLDPTASPGHQAEALLRELTAGDGGEEAAYRQGERLVPRLRPIEGSTGYEPKRLIPDTGGTLEQLRLETLTRRAPAPGEIEIQVRAAGVNFKDVLIALGRAGENPGALGAECAGEVTAVGAGVEAFRAGDRVVAFTQEALASYVTAPESLAIHLPAGVGFEAAATLPVAFLTAWYGLHELARLQPGERVLIHAATGGVGMAAVQIARAAGAEVYATASRGKWELARSLGAAHVMDSRSLSFAEEVRERTGGRGVDVVLNSFSGPAIVAGFSALAPGGRFLEIGKTEIWSRERAAAERPDVAYHPFDMKEILAAEPAWYRSLIEKILAQVEAGGLTPLPRRLYSLERAPEAFRLMAGARHTGKIVVTPSHPVELRPDGAYLVTGGSGFAGRQLARWLVERGAGHVLLVGRREPPDELRELAREWELRGTRITLARADVADPEALSAILAEVPDLRGVFHAAGVVSDALIPDLDEARFRTALEPKLHGACNLDRLTRGRDLDFFVLFSSAAALLGSAGQASYGAANAALDAIAWERRAAGLPACAINWGPLEGGMLASLSEAERTRWASRGMRPLSPERLLQAVERAIQDGAVQRVVIDADWETVARFQPSPLLSELVAPGPRPSSHASLEQVDPSERRAVLLELLRGEAARILGYRGGRPLDGRRPLAELGLDSLLAVELRNTLAGLVGCSLPSTLFFDYPTLDGLTDYLLSRLFPAEVTEAAEEATGGPADGDILDLLARELGMTDGL
ncbi:MAG: SDR family NAD(P)-dependent oxidoreductase [Armatimonadota bacterium]